MTATINPTRTTTTVDSPVGVLTLVAHDGALAGLYMSEQRHAPSIEAAEGTAGFEAVTEQLTAYFRGELTRFDLPLAPVGTAWQQRVWTGLCDIPYGETTSYGELARRIGSPGAARAVGLANGRNPIGIIVPCHRVIGADGRLTGYGGGLPRKELLLALERGNTMLFG